MRDKLIDYYKILLDIGQMTSDDDGNVSVIVAPGDIRPATIGGKRVVLPTRDQMKNTNWDNRIGFHPIREAYNLSISDVLASLRDQYISRFNVTIACLMADLIYIGQDKDNQKHLSTEQAQVLNALTKCDSNTIKDWAALLKSTKTHGEAMQFINIFIKRGGEYKGQAYGRVGIVTFPIYKALVDSKSEPINGVKISAKNREMFIKLFEYVFPQIADPEAYNVGVNARGAPYMEALIRSSFNVIRDLNEVAQLYIDVDSVKLKHLYQFPSDLNIWLEIFDDRDMVEKLSRVIPSLATNEGEDNEAPKAAEPAPRREESRMGAPAQEAPRVTSSAPAPRGRMVLGATSLTVVKDDLAGKLSPGQARSEGSDRATISSGSVAQSRADLEAEQRRQREIQDRERRERNRQEEEERRREREERRREEEEYEARRRELDREFGRDRDRDRDYRDRDRGRERDRRSDYRDRDERRSTGDVFEDNPVLRGNTRDEEDDRRYRDRGRGRGYDDDRRGGRIRDIRDDARRGSYRDDYRDDDRYYRRR